VIPERLILEFCCGERIRGLTGRDVCLISGEFVRGRKRCSGDRERSREFLVHPGRTVVLTPPLVVLPKRFT
jgi:hypothetical protein